MDKGKSVVAFLYAAAVIIVPFIDRGGQPTATEYVQMAIGVVTALGVYLVPLVLGHTWVKSAVGALLAALQVAVTLIDNGLNGNDVLMIVLAALAALGILVAPAKSDTGVAVGFGGDAALR